MATKTKKKLAKNLIIYSLLIIFVVYALFPLYWITTGSLKPISELFARPQVLFPCSITLEYYNILLFSTNFPQFLWNSIIVALATASLNVAIGCMAAYSFTHFKFVGRMALSRFILLVYLFPQIILVIPLYLILNSMHLLDSLSGLILTYLSISLPFTIWLFMGYARTIPVEIEDAAKIDGCGNFGVFIHIVLPLLSPALPAGAMFAFISAWNEFLYALVMISGTSKKTLPVGFYTLLGSETLEWGPLLAWLTLTVLPSMVFFLFIYRRIVKGLAAGAVKG